jgi:GPI mannosyltransferase 3
LNAQFLRLKSKCSNKGAYADGGRLYGTHHALWYLWAGIPAITGLVLPFVLSSIRTGREFAQTVLWIVILTYTSVHSLSTHKEFRFLMPLLPAFCLLAGAGMQQYFHRKKLLHLYLFALFNCVVFLYLGLFHQRAPIDVNKAILRLVGQEPQTYTIHYLAGCHSTPIYSHLHKQSIRFEVWTLDCSPECRENPKRPCESDIFSQDPGSFMEDTYFQCKDFEEGTCVTDLRIFFPDFLVAFSSDLSSMKSRIATMGMTEVGRFVHGINGLRIPAAGIQVGESLEDSNNTILSVFFGKIEIKLEEMVVFQSKEVRPNF